MTPSSSHLSQSGDKPGAGSSDGGPSVVLMSAGGAPGVTTSAVLLAAVWPQAVLVEADPSGGDLRYWYSDATGLPLRPDLGVVSLLTAASPTSASRSLPPVEATGQDPAWALGTTEVGGLLSHSQQLPGGLPVLVGPSGPAQVDALRGQWPQLAAEIASHPGPVLLDAGRLATADLQPTLSLLRTCGRTLVVCRPTVAAAAHTRDLNARLRQQGIAADVLLIGRAADHTDVARTVGVDPDRVHVLPDDPAAAEAVTGSWTRRLDRSPLVVAARRAAAHLHAQLAPATSTLAASNDNASPVPLADRPAGVAYPDAASTASAATTASIASEGSIAAAGTVVGAP